MFSDCWIWFLQINCARLCTLMTACLFISVSCTVSLWAARSIAGSTTPAVNASDLNVSTTAAKRPNAWTVCTDLRSSLREAWLQSCTLHIMIYFSVQAKAFGFVYFFRCFDVIRFVSGCLHYARKNAFDREEHKNKLFFYDHLIMFVFCKSVIHQSFIRSESYVNSQMCFVLLFDK